MLAPRTDYRLCLSYHALDDEVIFVGVSSFANWRSINITVGPVVQAIRIRCAEREEINHVKSTETHVGRAAGTDPYRGVVVNSIGGRRIEHDKAKTTATVMPRTLEVVAISPALRKDGAFAIHSTITGPMVQPSGQSPFWKPRNTRLPQRSQPS